VVGQARELGAGDADHQRGAYEDRDHRPQRQRREVEKHDRINPRATRAFLDVASRRAAAPP